ncbi:MAG: hypothetical protein K0R38_1198 [Polyangiaceae bacterium]|nr:hypothetical protein [Polyangiaceae bacterium]
MPRYSAPLVLGLFLAASPRVATAAPEPTPSEISVARRLFEEGKAAEDAGRYRDAADRFRKAIAIKDTPGMRFHLARCEEEQGALVEALVEYDRAREMLDSGFKAPDVERLLPEARQRVQDKVASVTLRLPPRRRLQRRYGRAPRAMGRRPEPWCSLARRPCSPPG